MLVAAAACGDAALQNAAEMIQLHGGIGYTWEHFAHLYLRRAKADQYLFGPHPSQHRHRLGAAALQIPSRQRTNTDPGCPRRRWTRLRRSLSDPTGRGDHRRRRPAGERREAHAGAARLVSPARRSRVGHTDLANPVRRPRPGPRRGRRRGRGAAPAAASTGPRESFVGVWLAGPTILQWGTDEQRETYLHPLAAGNLAGANCSVSRAPDPDLVGVAGDLGGADRRRSLVGGRRKKIWSSFAKCTDFGLLMTAPRPVAAQTRRDHVVPSRHAHSRSRRATATADDR